MLACARRSEKLWLGGRDSNPDNMLQRHASYRWTTSQYQSKRSKGTELSIIAARKQGAASASAGTGRSTRNVSAILHSCSERGSLS